jgi:hypothetical protein
MSQSVFAQELPSGYNQSWEKCMNAYRREVVKTREYFQNFSKDNAIDKELARFMANCVKEWLRKERACTYVISYHNGTSPAYADGRFKKCPDELLNDARHIAVIVGMEWEKMEQQNGRF